MKRWLETDDLALLTRVRESKLFYRYLFKIGQRYIVVLVREDR